jgi:hypothetical protein
MRRARKGKHGSRGHVPRVRPSSDPKLRRLSDGSTSMSYQRREDGGGLGVGEGATPGGPRRPLPRPQRRQRQRRLQGRQPRRHLPRARRLDCRCHRSLRNGSSLFPDCTTALHIC